MTLQETNKTLCYLTPVLSVEDNEKGLRIKVCLEGIDKKMPSDKNLRDAAIANLPYCFPILPKFLNINPKVGELVLVFFQTTEGFYGNRFFIGPIISQDYFLKKEAAPSAHVLLNGKSSGYGLKPSVSPDMNPDNKGSIPDRDDIALRGRSNADIILKDSDIRLRCGIVEDPSKGYPNNLAYNNVDPAEIQMKYETSPLHPDYNSSVNIVADRINLISHDSKTDFSGLLTDPKEMVTKEGMKKILEDGHPLPYGDKLIEFLTEFVRIFKTHMHAYVKSPIVLPANDMEILSQDLTQMLSQSIRIN